MSDVLKKAVTIYNFHDAPKEWRALSPFSGDEDWIIIADGDDETEHEAEYLAACIAVTDRVRLKLPDGRLAFITCFR